eukprot:3779851-Pleurochrysis_carterae.AAC.2
MAYLQQSQLHEPGASADIFMKTCMQDMRVLLAQLVCAIFILLLNSAASLQMVCLAYDATFVQASTHARRPCRNRRALHPHAEAFVGRRAPYRKARRRTTNAHVSAYASKACVQQTNCVGEQLNERAVVKQNVCREGVSDVPTQAHASECASERDQKRTCSQSRACAGARVRKRVLSHTRVRRQAHKNVSGQAAY